MSYEINSETGRLEVNGTPVYATMSGRLDCMVRCPNEDTFNAVALQVGMLSEQTDSEGNTYLVSNPDVDISRIGSVTLNPGEYDFDTETYVVEPIIDYRYHVNFRLGSKALESGAWETWIVQWMTEGTQAVQINKNEQAIEHLSVELIDPQSIATPTNVWL